MNRLIDRKRLATELEAASTSKAATAPELAAALAGPAGKSKATVRDVHDLLDAALSMTAAKLKHVVENAETALADLEARIAALEAKRLMSFAGPHDPGHAYAPGEVVQRGGALFVAMAHARVGDSPGSHAAWREIARAK